MSADALQQAMEHQQRGRLAEAESIYRELLRADPASAAALHAFGVLRMRQGKQHEAIEMVKRSLHSDPGNAVAWNNLANMLLAMDPNQAESAYTRATQLKPDFTGAWYNLGNLLRDLQRPHDALRCYERVIELKPRFKGAYENIARFASGHSAIAGDAYRGWLAEEPDNPVARHMAAAYAGENVPARADDAYIVDVFDRSAGAFDAVLAKLEYAAPNLLAAALARVIPVDQPIHAILDAGCGTGLCGPLLRSAASSLIGVDLSPAMIEKARQRNCYDELHTAELMSFMRAHPARFDVVICADTLVYFGALEEAMMASAASLSAGGVLAFTVEAEPADLTQAFRLYENGRYKHSEPYVRTCLEAAQFEVLQIEPGILRKEGTTGVNGHIVLAKKGTSRFTR